MEKEWRTILPDREALPPSRRFQAAEQAWFDSHAAKWIRDEEIRDISAARQQYEDRRTINRASHERYMEKYQYGYDIVDQRDFR